MSGTPGHHERLPGRTRKAGMNVQNAVQAAIDKFPKRMTISSSSNLWTGSATDQLTTVLGPNANSSSRSRPIRSLEIQHHPQWSGPDVTHRVLRYRRTHRSIRSSTLHGADELALVIHRHLARRLTNPAVHKLLLEKGRIK